MADKSRIKFNPVTKEIEIEGSEQFVKIYFDKVQAMLLGRQKTIVTVPIKEKPVKEKQPSRKAPKVAKEKITREKTPKGDMTSTVLNLILTSPAGITTGDLKEKTGLEERQIWGIVGRAKKMGKIKQGKRGLYIGA